MLRLGGGAGGQPRQLHVESGTLTQMGCSTLTHAQALASLPAGPLASMLGSGWVTIMRALSALNALSDELIQMVGCKGLQVHQNVWHVLVD